MQTDCKKVLATFFFTIIFCYLMVEVSRRKDARTVKENFERYRDD